MGLLQVLALLAGALVPSLASGPEHHTGRTPRVALLFASRGDMPLEPVWNQFLHSVKGLRPPALSQQQWKAVMEDERVEGIKRRLHEVGHFTANRILQNEVCADNVVIKEAADMLEKSWEKTDKNAPLPRRGAKLRNPNAVPHPVYASQELFSVYVHVPPEFESYPESSIFFGREITPSIRAERFQHSLGMLSLLLLEAALHDESVANARFAVISEADAPLYNAGAMYLQLMLSHRSRLGPTYSFEELLHVDSESSAVSPLMFVHPFTKDHFTKSTQWVSLTRAAAVAAVHDRIVEPWFATFAGSRWRCRFIAEATQIFPEIERLLQRGVNLRTRHAAMQLRRNNALPPNFTQGEILDGILPEPRDTSNRGSAAHSTTGGSSVSTSAVPFWASGLRSVFAHKRGQEPQAPVSPLDNLTPVQQEALESYRRELKIQPPTWAYMPFDLSKWKKHDGPDAQATRSSSAVVSEQGGAEGEEQQISDEEQQREQIWASLLGGQRASHSRGAARHGRKILQGQGLTTARARRAAGKAGGGAMKSAVMEREMKRLEEQTASDDKKEEEKREDIMMRHNKASEYVQGRLTQRAGFFTQRTSMRRGISIYDLLRERVSVNKTLDRPYNIEWPLPNCAWCQSYTARDPWERWTMDQQMDFLYQIFPGAASRVVNIVSDECMVKSMMNFYGIKGPEWQTDAFSSHVDWARANNGGHPGVYSQLMLQVDPDFIRRMVRQTHCDSQAQALYRSAGELFAGSANHAPTGANATAPLSEVWPHTTLADQCVLFARKFLPGTGQEANSFFGPCNQVGLEPRCIHPLGLDGMQSGAAAVNG